MVLKELACEHEVRVSRIPANFILTVGDKYIFIYLFIYLYVNIYIQFMYTRNSL